PTALGDVQRRRHYQHSTRCRIFRYRSTLHYSWNYGWRDERLTSRYSSCFAPAKIVCKGEKFMRSPNKLSRRSFLKAAAAGGVGLALADALPAFARAKATTNINYWHHFTSDTEFQGLDAVMALFAKKYPDIKLTQENIPNADFMAKFTAAVAA